jgi:hypothetical protein
VAVEQLVGVVDQEVEAAEDLSGGNDDLAVGTVTAGRAAVFRLARTILGKVGGVFIAFLIRVLDIGTGQSPMGRAEPEA